MNVVTVSKTEQIIKDIQPRPFGKVGKIWLGFLIAICIVGSYAYYCQLRDGLVVTAMGDYVSWGIYISNFVFFVAIRRKILYGIKSSYSSQQKTTQNLSGR